MFEEAHVLDLLPAYVLGSLDDDEAGLVKEHLLSCLICRNASSALQAVSEQLSLVAPVATPSSDLKDRLLRRVQTARARSSIPVQGPPPSWLERLRPGWSLAALCLIIVLAGVNLLLWQRLTQWSIPDAMRIIPLSSPDGISRASGYVLISRDGDNGVLVVDGLPSLAESQQYQLWLIRDGQKTSGAVFSTEESYAHTRIHAPGSLLEYSAVDITIEPVGGSLQPTGDHVLGGPLSSP